MPVHASLSFGSVEVTCRTSNNEGNSPKLTSAPHEEQESDRLEAEPWLLPELRDWSESKLPRVVSAPQLVHEADTDTVLQLVLARLRTVRLEKLPMTARLPQETHDKLIELADMFTLAEAMPLTSMGKEPKTVREGQLVHVIVMLASSSRVVRLSNWPRTPDGTSA